MPGPIGVESRTKYQDNWVPLLIPQLSLILTECQKQKFTIKIFARTLVD